MISLMILFRVPAPSKFLFGSALKLGSSSKLVRLRGAEGGLSVDEDFFLLRKGLLVLPPTFLCKDRECHSYFQEDADRVGRPNRTGYPQLQQCWRCAPLICQCFRQ